MTFTAEEAPHVHYDEDARILICDRCHIEDTIDENEPNGHIAAFTSVHSKCPEVATEESRKRARDRMAAMGLSKGLGLVPG
jgi:hypothetical protein